LCVSSGIVAIRVDAKDQTGGDHRRAGAETGQFSESRGVALDTHGHLIVAECGEPSGAKTGDEIRGPG